MAAYVEDSRKGGKAMDNLIDQLVSMKVEEKTDYQSILPLGKGIGYFAMSEYTVGLDVEKSTFLKKLEAQYKGQVLITKLQSSRYFFNIGGKTILEVATIVGNDKIKVVPYVLYFDDDIKKDIQRNIVRERKLYQIFKCVGLQE